MLRKRKALWIIVCILLVAAAGGGYYYYRTMRTSGQETEESQLQTSRVRVGDLVMSATGAGTVIASDEVALSIPSDAELLAVHVELGDTVEAGDLLAEIDDMSARQAVLKAEANLLQAERALTTAEEDYEESMEGPSEAEVLAAQAAVEMAQENLADLEAGPTQA